MNNGKKQTTGNCSDNSISVLNQYENLWRCRDFELSHLWQRTVFLQALLLLCFTGYGSLLLNAFDKVCSGKIGQSDNWRIWLDAIAIPLAVLAIVVSILWIMMAKASKLWYERYESAIDAFVAYDGHRYVDEALKKGKETWVGFQFYQIKGYEEPKSDKALETTKGGRYSPSRLNILIGQLSLIVWMIVASGHLTDLVLRANLTGCQKVVLFPASIFVALLSLVSLAVWVASKTLSRKRGILSAGSTYA